MADDVRFISFDEVPGAPRLAVPSDFNSDQIKEYLKSPYVEQSLAEKGYAFKYGLQPVDMLELENLDDWVLTSGLKKGWLSAKALGQGYLAWFNDVVNDEEGKEEALRAARQYQLDRAANAFKIDTDTGEILPRVETLEDIANDDRHLLAFTKYVREKFGEAAATSFPTLLLSAIGGGIGGILGGVTTAGPGALPGAVYGSIAGRTLGGLIFGLGETYLSQAEETDDPNLALSLALAVPYAAAENIGIGSVPSTLIKTFGTKKLALKALQEKGIYSPLLKGGKINKTALAKEFGKGIGKTSIEEALAESIQETLTHAGGGIEAGKSFEQMFNNKEFANQLKEAAAAGFFGGMPFGTLNPLAKSIKLIGRGTGPRPDLVGGTNQTIIYNDDDAAFTDLPFERGSLVTVDNKYNADVKPERKAELETMFKKPQFVVLGRASVDKEDVFVLQSNDIKPATVIVPYSELGRVNVVEDPKSGGEGKDEKENFIYDDGNQNLKITGNIRKTYSQNKENLAKTGWIDDANEATVTKLLGGENKIINDTVTEILGQRKLQREERQIYEKSEAKQEGSNVVDFVPALQSDYAPYDSIADENLEEAVKKDLPYWRSQALAQRAEGDAQENKITEDQENELRDLGFWGPLGQEYVNDRLRNNLSPVGKKRTTQGRERLNYILKNKVRFSSIPDYLGGPQVVKQQIGEKISRKEPLTAEERASLTGDKLIPAIKYNPLFYTESSTFEDLYDKPVEQRIRAVLELASKLDANSIWKLKDVAKIKEEVKKQEQTLINKIAAAKFAYGPLSQSVKDAEAALKKWRNLQEHELENPFDPDGGFSLLPILSPTAFRKANLMIQELQANLKSDDITLQQIAKQKLPAYVHIRDQTMAARRQINELLRSMTIEPITEWHNLTFRKVKTAMTKYIKQINQKETIEKRIPITTSHTMLQVDDTQGNPNVDLKVDFENNRLTVAAILRDELNRLGLTGIDLQIVSYLADRIAGEYRSDVGTAIPRAIVLRNMRKDFKPPVNLGLITLAFDLDEFFSTQKTQKEALQILAIKLGSLNHEAIHALYDMGAFTDTEWNYLKKYSKEQWVERYGVRVKKGYYAFYRDQGLTDSEIEEKILEEGIAFAYQHYALGIQDVGELNDSSKIQRTIQRVFRRIKAFLLALAKALKMVDFKSPNDIFDQVQAGIVGARLKTEGETKVILDTKEVQKATLINENGDLVISNNLLNDAENREYQTRVLRQMLGEKYVSYQDKIDAVINPKFEIELNKIKWSMTKGMGYINYNEPYFSMYTYMPIDSFLDFVPPLETSNNPADFESINAIVEGMVDKKPVAAPYIHIEINEDGTLGRVRSHEGRHRAHAVAKLLGNQYFKIPVAIRFTRKGAPDAFKDRDKGGRNDIANKRFLQEWLKNGQLKNEQGNITIGADILGPIYQSFREEDTYAGNYIYGRPYTTYSDSNAMYQLTGERDPLDTMNRAEERISNNKLDKTTKSEIDLFDGTDTEATPYKLMSLFSSVFGHARAWAKKNTPFRKMYKAIMNRVAKSRSFQMSFTAKLRERFLEVIKDPVALEALTKAMIIAQQTDVMPSLNENNELIFVAPADSNDKHGTVKKGEVVILQGDVAQAFKDHHLVMASINKEFLKAEIAREQLPNLREALDILQRFFPLDPKIQEIVQTFETYRQNAIAVGMKPGSEAMRLFMEDSINYFLENFNSADLQFVVDRLSDIMIMRTSMDMETATTINRLIGTKNSGLHKVLKTAYTTEAMSKKPYAPLSRFGAYFLTVKKTIVNEDGKEEEITLWYEQFESKSEAQQTHTELKVRFPDAKVSQPAKQTIATIRKQIKEASGKNLNIEYLAQFMSDINAKRFQQSMEELRIVLEAKGLDKDVLGYAQFRTPRDKSVGMEGVPGYDPDFVRSTMQYIVVASDALAKNRFETEIRRQLQETVKFADNKNDVNLRKAATKFYEYVNNPVHEFAMARRIGFWWFLGGNMSSAILQTMSAVQFTGPLLSQVAGVAPTTKAMAKAFADASAMLVNPISGDKQFADAFINFDKLPDDLPGLRDALMRAIADGTIKQGAALQEAGMVRGPASSLVGSKRWADSNFRAFESIAVGGAFNTIEALSRLTAFIAAYRLAQQNSNVLENANTMYETDMDYQNQKDRYGETPESFARFMTEETFGVYGKENRPWLARNFGALPALFMTYISQMFGLLYRLLNPFGMADPAKGIEANSMGRKAFAKIMLMMIMTGGLLGLPGGEDAEDMYNIVRRQITGVDRDVRSEFREMLYSAGWGPTMIDALESGLFNAFLNVDVQRRIGFGIAPWSTQARALISLTGVQTGSKAEEFLGAPGAVYIDFFNNMMTRGLREGELGDALIESAPLAVKNGIKSFNYAMGKGYTTTSYGQVVTDDIGAVDILSQALGFTPTEISKNREALYLTRKLDRAGSAFKQRMNARITNAYVKIIQGGKQHRADLINDGQKEIQEVWKRVAKHNLDNPKLFFVPDGKRLFQEALKAVDPNYAILSGPSKTMTDKYRLRQVYGLN